MKERVKKIIEECGKKHFSQGMRRDKELNTFIEQNYPDSDMTNAEIAWCIMHDENPFCGNGKKRAWDNIDRGFRPFCGKGKNCQCYMDSVSDLTKKGIVIADRDTDAINVKRENTNLVKYGVKNVSQVEEINEKREATVMERFGVNSILCIQDVKEAGMLERYGHVNPTQVPEIKSIIATTNTERYGVDHYMKQHHIRKEFSDHARKTHPSRVHISNAAREILDNKDKFIAYASTKSFQEAIFELNISQVLYHKHCRLYGLTDGYRSSLERSFASFLTSLDIRFISNNKSIIKPLELDFYLPDYNLAFELDGLRFHSEIAGGKDKNYHFDKMKRCNEIGVRLVSIFDDEWVTKNSACKKRVINILKKSEKGVGARKLVIKELPWRDVKQFMDNNHLQGSGASTAINLAAFNENEMVAVMTFAKGRYIMSSHNKNLHELVRFVTDGKNNPGIASKMLKTFIKKYNPKEIISFSDNRWSKGNLYSALGFSNGGMTDPTYWYTKRFAERIHKSNLRKDRIISMVPDHKWVDSTTEWEMVQDLGYDRVWDCGMTRWVLKF